MQTPPNILFIITDQQRFDHLGLKGVTGIETPHLDRLGREGVLLDRSYCPCPICTPTRLSMLTGLYPSHHGGYSIGLSPDPFPETTIPGALKQKGYRTALFGKTHFVARPDEETHMAGGKEPAEDFFKSWTGPYCGFDFIQASTGHTINHKPSMHYREFLKGRGEDYTPWFPQLGPEYDHNACGSWNIPAEVHDTQWVADCTRAFIRDTTDQPWYCWAAFQDPHEPHVCPEPWFSRVDADNMPELEGYREGEFDDKPDIYRRLHQEPAYAGEDEHGIPCVRKKDRLTRQRKEAMQATLGMVAFLDHQVGEIMKTLEETGQADRTLVVFTSDHGEMHGHHGFWGKGLTAYDDCQRVPLLIWGPKLFSKRGMCNPMVSLVDLPATFLQLAGVEDYPHTQGTNLLPYLREETDDVQKGVVVECRANRNEYNQITYVTRDYKLILTQPEETGELYNLREDPDQYRNLWSHPDVQVLKAELLEELLRTRMRNEPSYTPRFTFG